MPIVPGTQPIQGPQRRSEPFQPLPVQQIASSSQRLTERLQNVRGAHSELMAQIANQEVLPQNQQAFELATQGVRQRLKELSQDDQFFNKLPQVRREARRFAQVAKGFKQNKEAIQESLKSLDEAEGLTDSQRAIERRKILRNASVQLNEDGTVDPNSISRAQQVQPGQDPKEFLDDTLGSLEPLTRNDISIGEDTITESTLTRVGFERLQKQGFRELGFAATEENGEISLRRAGSANPKVDRWMDRQQQVFQAQAAAKMRQQGKDPQENQEELRERVNQAMEDKVINMVNTVAQRHISGDVNPDVTIKGRPGSSNSGDSEEDSGFTEGTAVVGTAFSAKDAQTKKTEEAVTERWLSKQINENNNIDRKTFNKIDEIIPENRRDISFNPIAGGDRGIKPEVQQVINQYGEDTFEAYESIKRGEKNTRASVGEFATEERKFNFPTGSKEANELNRKLEKMTANQFASPDLTEEQLKFLLKDENNFTPVDMAQDMSWLRVKVKNREDMPSSGGFIGIGADKPEGTVVLKIPDEPVSPGRGGKSAKEDLLSFLSPENQELARFESMVSDQGFGTEWEPVKQIPDVKLKLGTAQIHGDPRIGKQPIEQRFHTKVGDQPLTFERMADATLSKEDLSDQQLNQITSELARSATQKLPAITNLKSQGALRNLSTADVQGMITQWFKDKSEMSETGRQITEMIMKSNIPADRKGRALQWANTFKELNQ